VLIRYCSEGHPDITQNRINYLIDIIIRRILLKRRLGWSHGAVWSDKLGKLPKTFFWTSWIFTNICYYCRNIWATCWIL